jgi:SpoVK/Ycf46/Vps4 family AAA+-type ATPase
MMQINHTDIVALIEAALDANYTNVRSIGTSIAQKISAENSDIAKQIKSIIRKKGVPLRSSGYSESLPLDPKSRTPLIEEQSWPVVPLFLNHEAHNVFDTFLRDAKNVDVLMAHGLSGKMNLLISGPPGTGKSLLAGHIAAQLGKPLYIIRLDAMVSSLLGDTARNIRSIFDFVPSKGGVLFLDEVDAIAKVRDDKHELGELKRVVNTLLQGIDSLDDHSVVIAATNHSKLLDPAIWRRFPYKINTDYPELKVRLDLWAHYLSSHTENIIRLLGVVSDGLSGADIESLALAARRNAILSDKEVDYAGLVHSVLNSSPGNTATPERNDMDSDRKKITSTVLSEKYGVTQADIGRLLGVSRQAVSNYLKE